MLSLTTTAKVLSIIGIIWALTLGRTVLVMLFGKKIFKKASKGEKTAIFPIINLFTMLEIADISIFWGILLFVPILNLITLIMMSYKLGVVFNTSGVFKIGLVIFPIMFYPLLAISDKQYKVSDEEYFRALDSARGESINLMTDDEIKIEVEQNTSEEEPIEEVDSIFKGNVKTIEKVAPYKAAKIDILEMQMLKNTDEEENILNNASTDKSNANNNGSTTEEKKKDIEMIDL